MGMRWNDQSHLDVDCCERISFQLRFYDIHQFTNFSELKMICGSKYLVRI